METDDLPGVEPTPGLPESLCDALRDWAERAEPEEVAAWSGWSETDVRRALHDETEGPLPRD
ncbi:hypothetical protein E4K10_30155 [Streptomyces sp. T1317-0309]|nr:hypothetical protein E4K10_30155 [Streptomyces sp. T1317-0309]